MKIFIVADGFFPGKKYGGPPVSIDNFCTLMSDCECYVVTRNHDLGEKKPYNDIENGWNRRENCSVAYLSDDEYSMSSFEKYICEIKPDIIYLQSLYQSCVLPCLILSKKYGIKLFLAPRGELCSGAFRKKYKKIPYILALRMTGLLNNVHFQSTSDEETCGIKKYLGASQDRIFFLTNIPSIPHKQPGINELNSKKAGEAKLVFLSRIHPTKNLLQAIRCLRNVNGNVVFDVYGSLQDENYWELCQNEIKALPENIKVNYRGLVEHSEVHNVFSRYDAFLFPTFSENYGHVIIEALTAGCPVIVSDRTPWNDLESAGAGFVCSLEDAASFERAVQVITDSETGDYRKNALLYAKRKIRLESLREEYLNAFKAVLRFRG